MGLDCFLERAASGDRCVETADGRAADSSLHDACPRLKIFCDSFHGKGVAAPLHRRACAGAYAFFAVSVACTTTVVLTSTFAGVYVKQVF